MHNEICIFELYCFIANMVILNYRMKIAHEQVQMIGS